MYIAKHGDESVDAYTKTQTQSKGKSNVEQRNRQKHDHNAKRLCSDARAKPAPEVKPKATEKVQKPAEK